MGPGRPWLLWGSWGVWVAALGVLYAAVPPSPDQSQHDYMGWILLQGGAPYVDYVEHNWPGGPWLHALATRLFGVNLHSWHAFDLLLLLPVLFAALGPLREAAGRWAAAWFLFLYPALYTTMGSWFAGERDAVAGHLLFLSACLCWRASSPRRAWPWAAAAATSAAAAALIKPTAALFAPLLLLSRLLEPPRPERRFVGPAVFAAGYAAALTTALGLLYAEGSSWRAFADAAIRFNVESYGVDRVPPRDQLRRAVEALLVWWPWITVGALLSVLHAAIGRNRVALRFAALMGAVFATGIASYVAQGKGFDYHLAMAFVSLVATLALGLGPLTEAALATPRTTRGLAALAVLLIPLLGTAIKVAHAFDSPAGWLLGRTSTADHLGAYPAGDDLSVAEASALAERLRNRVPEGGTILVWGRANVINYLAERPQPTRFHHNLLIMRARPPVSTADAWNRTFVEELERRPPDVAAVNRHELWSSEELPSAGTLFLREFLATRYLVVERVGGMLVCEPRRDEPRSADGRPGTREPCG